MITIRDVAKCSGYSITTVSIVMNDAPLARYIPEGTKLRIRSVARELSYRPNVFARSLRSKRSHTVGVMVFDITDPFCTQTLRGIENALYSSTYAPILTDIQNDRERFRRHLQMLLDRRVEGLIALANSLFLETSSLGALEQRGVPTVAIGRQLETNSISSVIVDNEAGARTALAHLYELGHRKIAFLRGSKMLVDSEERWRGLSAFAGEVSLSIDPKLVVELKKPAASSEQGRKATEELLRRGQPFTALMAFDDMTAFGAIRALQRPGLKVPEDCSVIGFDDVAAAAFYNPALTTIHQPMGTLGSMAVHILLDAIQATLRKKTFTPAHKKATPSLVVRESTAPLAST